jgi:drug/metabolite transporter (DMT)-like permease
MLQNKNTSKQDQTYLSHPVAIAFTIIFFALYAITDGLAKYWQIHYSNTSQLLAGLNLIGLVTTNIVAVFMYRKDWACIYKTKNIMKHSMRGAALVLGVWMIMYALKTIPLTSFYGVIFTAPFFACVLAYFFLKEAVSFYHWLLVIVGFFGVLIVISPFFDGVGGGQDVFLGYLAGICAAFCFSVGGICVKSMGAHEHPITFVLYGQWAVFLFHAPIAVSNFEPYSLFHSLIFIPYGLMICGAVFLHGYTFSKCRSISLVIPFQYTQIIWATLIGVFIFGESLSAISMIGIFVIILAGLGLMRLNRTS